LKRGFYRRGDDYVLLLGTNQGWTAGYCSLVWTTQADLEGDGWRRVSITSLDLDATDFEKAGWKWVRPDSVPVVWRRYLTRLEEVVPLLSGRSILQIPGRKKGLDVGRLEDSKPVRRGARAYTTEVFVPDYFMDYDLDRAIRHHLDERILPKIPELDSTPDEADDLTDTWLGTAEDVLFYLVVRNRMFLPFEDDLPRGMTIKTAFRRYISDRGGGPVRKTLHRLLAKVDLAPKDKVVSVRLHTNRSNEGLVWKWAHKKHLKALLWEDGLGLRHVVPDGWATIFWQGNVTLLARPVERSRR
jgi:hypothetical protein